MKALRISVVIILLTFAGQAGAATLTTLNNFTGTADGGQPFAGLVQGSDGNFYGTTAFGGFTNLNSGSGFGTVFQITPTGTLTTLFQFTGVDDGGSPAVELIQGNNGRFYGTTTAGGLTNLNGGSGFGTVYQITSAGTLTTLHSFTGGVDGQSASELVQGSDGNFYGTASAGGNTNLSNGLGYGTVFQITPAGTLTTLYQFGGADGRSPVGGLVQGSDGFFYGTTGYGGVTNLNFGFGYGTVFRISSGGAFTNLHIFGNGDGQFPVATLVRGSDGNFYGTTFYGGNTNLNNGNGFGTVFQITTAGTLTTLRRFAGGADDQRPVGLVQGSDGSFYGATRGSIANGLGTLFQITPTGTLTTLHQFSNSGGKIPERLVQGSDGSFYGTTIMGGNTNANGINGTVFKLVVPLTPPANQISGIQLAGNDTVINIPAVAHETYQLQVRDSLTDGNWSNIPNASVSNSLGSTLTLTNFGGALAPQRFYRFDITP